jgi:hypothetical protein
LLVEVEAVLAAAAAAVALDRARSSAAARAACSWLSCWAAHVQGQSEMVSHHELQTKPVGTHSWWPVRHAAL